MIVEPRMVAQGSLSRVWAEAFCRVMEPGVLAFTPLVVSITDFAEDGLPIENDAIRMALDASMAEHGTGLSVETVAGTIFPHTFWHPGIPRDRLFARYRHIAPRLAHDARNRHGLYFERLTNFPGAPADGNQLDFILQCYEGNVRRKPALQATAFDAAVDLPGMASVFDAKQDLTRQRRRGFPCMQQVAFAPHHEAGTLSMSAFYASQYLFKRAYGNYLGLCRLGRFMAHEMGLRLERMTCYIGYASRDDTPIKTALGGLDRRLREILAQDATIIGASDVESVSTAVTHSAPLVQEGSP